MKNLKESQYKIEFPVSEAFSMSLHQIRKRFQRSMILVASIALGIAFMTHLTMTNLIFNAYMKETGTTIEAYQFWLLVLAFLVCSVGLINSYLIAVYERYTEIGIMKCLGALNQHILKLFIIEALLFGLFGGIVGFILGTITATTSSLIQLGLDVLQKLPIIDMFMNFSLIMVLSVTLTVISAIFPALRAAKLKPVEALRVYV